MFINIAMFGPTISLADLARRTGAEKTLNNPKVACRVGLCLKLKDF